MSLHSRGRWTFLLLAFGLAWGTVATSLIFDFSMLNVLAQLPIAFAPAVAALVVRRYVTKEGFGDAGLAPKFRSARWYYLAAWGGPVVALILITGLARAGGTPVANSAVINLLPLLAMALILTPVFWGEEYGWRGYLQQRLSNRPVVAVLGTGMIWGVWHWPLVLTDYVTYDRPIFGLGMWTLHSMMLGVVLAWLFSRSGTIWVACLAHAGSNLLLGVGTEELLVDSAGMAQDVVSLLGLAPVAALAVLLLATGRLRHRLDSGRSAPAPVDTGGDRVATRGAPRVTGRRPPDPNRQIPTSRQGRPHT